MRRFVLGSLVVACALVMGGCLPFAVGAAAGAAFGARIGDGMDRSKLGPPGTAAEKDFGAAVTVTFTEPRDVDAVVLRYDLSSEGVPMDPVLVPQVTRLVGRVQASRGDSLVVLLSEANGARGRVSFGGKRSAIIARDPRADVVVLDRHPSRSAGMLLGAVAGLLIVAILFVSSFEEGT